MGGSAEVGSDGGIGGPRAATVEKNSVRLESWVQTSVCEGGMPADTAVTAVA